MNTRASEGPAALDTLALSQTAMVAVLLAIQFVPQPHMSSGVAAQGGQPYGVPLVSFLVLAISLPAGYCMLLAGALRSAWRIRVSVVILVTGLLAIRPVTSLIGSGAGSPDQLATWLSALQLAVLAAFWLWAGIVTARERRSSQGGQAIRPQSGRRIPLGALFLLLVYYGLQFGIWLTFVQAGQASAGSGVLLSSIGAEILLLPLVLVFPILAFSTDWVNRAQGVVRSVLFFRRGERGRLLFSRSLPVLAAMLAAGMLAYEIWHGRSGLPGGLAAVLVAAAIVVLLVRTARVDRLWRQRVRPFWIFAAAAFIFVDASLLIDLNPFSPGLSNLVVSTAAALLRAPIALGVLTFALFLIMKGRAGNTDLGTGGLLLAMVALIVLIVTYPAALASAGLPTPQPTDLFGAIVTCAAAGTLVWLALSLRRGEWGHDTVRLRNTLVLLAGLLLVGAGYAFLRLVARLGPEYTVLLAALFLLPPLWDYLLPMVQRSLVPVLRARAPALAKLVRVLDGSGENRKNGDGENAEDKAKTADAQAGQAEQASQLMQTGYVLISNCVFLYLGTFREPVSGAVLPSFLTSDLTASAGLLILAPPLVVLGFILRIRHTVPNVAPTAEAGAAARSAGVSRRQVVGTAAIVTVAVTAALFLAGFSRTLHASEDQGYSAAAPSAYCDDGGAYWEMILRPPISADCTGAALELTVAAKQQSLMTFIPPSGYFTENYEVSAGVRFTRLASGCIVIETRMTAGGYYSTYVCNTGTWEIGRTTGSATALLAFGAIKPARDYTVAVTADGANQRLSVNGLPVASVSDLRSTGTQHVTLGVVNLTGSPGTVALSDFAFVPLAQSGRSGVDQPYLATQPGPGCDKGTAQWAMMTPRYTGVGCPAGGTVLTVEARRYGWLDFTPPGGIFPADYQISMLANLRQMRQGCAVIGTRMVAADGVLDEVCPNGAWFIYQRTARASALLAHGGVSRGTTYELRVTADAADQTLAIDGVNVARVPDLPSGSTAYVLLEALNLGTHTASAVFSHFAFTPLR